MFESFFLVLPALRMITFSYLTHDLWTFLSYFDLHINEINIFFLILTIYIYLSRTNSISFTLFIGLYPYIPTFWSPSAVMQTLTGIDFTYCFIYLFLMLISYLDYICFISFSLSMLLTGSWCYLIIIYLIISILILSVGLSKQQARWLKGAGSGPFLRSHMMSCPLLGSQNEPWFRQFLSEADSSFLL